ncbi:cytochrome c5 [Alcanivorax hongdengensis A-11-3]|uniref:Cytochrome c5 n=1 Tax=Alcanivorax hongdengensis A-11-3 TaxID=1177179 RepID=L0W9R8_9GAMM|nr:cytochrome c5 family protein [Alcanivorax hongdengensis]EKF73706.1 cytochrome c5 [Alcanivorax hongdengensis A-11-3]
MSKGIIAGLTIMLTLLVAGAASAKNAEEISPYPLGERSILSDRAVAERIKPVGSVCVKGKDCGASEVAAAGGDGEAKAPRSGEQVFNSACTPCHTAGVAGAPKVGNEQDWAPRIAKGEDTLLKHAVNGFNAMPPKGMCGDCSEQEIQNAIEYMIHKSE